LKTGRGSVTIPACWRIWKTASGTLILRGNLIIPAWSVRTPAVPDQIQLPTRGYCAFTPPQRSLAGRGCENTLQTRLRWMRPQKFPLRLARKKSWHKPRGIT